MRRDLTVYINADGALQFVEDNADLVTLDCLVIDDRGPQRRTARLEARSVDALVTGLEELIAELAKPRPARLLPWRRRA